MAKFVKLRKTVQLPEGATGGRWVAVYDNAYLSALGLSGGRYEGPMVLLQGVPGNMFAFHKEGWASIPTYDDRLAVLHGADTGDALPGLVQLTVYPSGPGKYKSFTLSGQPRDTGEGYWDLTPYDAPPGPVFATEQFAADLQRLISQGNQTVSAAQTAAQTAANAGLGAQANLERAQAIIALAGQAVQDRDNWLDLVAGQAIPPGLFSLPWYPSGMAVTVAPVAGTGMAPQANAYQFAATGGPQRWGIAFADLPITTSGIIRVKLIHLGGSVSEQQLTVLAQMQGANGSEKAVLAQIDIQTQTLKLGAYTPTFQNLTTPIPYTSAINQAHWIELFYGAQTDGTFLYMVKAWKDGTAEPTVAQMTATSGLVTGQGRTGILVRGGTVQLGTRSFNYPYNQQQTPTQGGGTTSAASEPRGTGGTTGRLTSRTPGTFARYDAKNTDPLASLDRRLLALIDVDNKPILEGQTGRVTGLAGFTAGKRYRLDVAPAVGQTNLVATPDDPLPNGWPDATIWNVNQHMLIVGSCIADGSELYFKMASELLAQPTATPAPVVVKRMDISLATWPYDTDLFTAGLLYKQLVNTGASVPRILADDHTGVPTPAAVSPLMKDVSGTQRRVFIRSRPFATLEMMSPADWPDQLGGEMLLMFACDSSNFTSNTPFLYFSGTGTNAAGAAGEYHRVRGLSSNLTIEKIVTSGNTISSTTSLAGNKGVVWTANEYWHLRVKVDSAQKVVYARAWKEGTAEPTTWLHDAVSVPDVKSGRWGWGFANGYNRVVKAALAPEGTAASYAP